MIRNSSFVINSLTLQLFNSLHLSLPAPLSMNFIGSLNKIAFTMFISLTIDMQLCAYND